MRLAVEILNLFIVISGIVLGWLGVVGMGFAINDGNIANHLPQENIPIVSLLECAAIPLGLIVLFVVPSLMVVRRGKPVLALSLALVPSISLVATLALVVFLMRCPRGCGV